MTPAQIAVIIGVVFCVLFTGGLWLVDRAYRHAERFEQKYKINTSSNNSSNNARNLGTRISLVDKEKFSHNHPVEIRLTRKKGAV